VPSVESFLTLEASLQRALKTEFAKANKETVKELEALVVGGDFAEAEKVANQGIDTVTVAKKVRPKLETHFLQAMLLGAGLFRGTVRSTDLFKRGEIPKAVDLAVIQLQTIVVASQKAISARACTVVSQMAERERQEQEGEIEDGSIVFDTLYKVADQELARQMNAAVMGTGSGLMDAGANLATSRLVSYGYVAEAIETGVTTFQVSEVMDNRTCPVCRGMHGKTFSVEQAERRLFQQLQMTGDELKGAAPFPNQSKQGLRNLAGMTDQHLADMGWDTPPYHPLCRGILVPVGTVHSVEVVGFSKFTAPADPALAPVESVVNEIPSEYEAISQGVSSDLTGSKAKQNTDDLDVLYEQAAEVDPIFKQAVADAADDTGGTAVFPTDGLKSRARVIEKAEARYGGDFAGITDISRATLEFNTLEGVYATLDYLTDTVLSIVRINDRFFNPTPEGYRDIILGVEMPGGHVVELQLHVSSMRNTKELNHLLYERQRTISDQAQIDGRELTLLELEEVESLVSIQQVSYGAVMAEILGGT
jgi:hypothetical protein